HPDRVVDVEQPRPTGPPLEARSGDQQLTLDPGEVGPMRPNEARYPHPQVKRRTSGPQAQRRRVVLRDRWAILVHLDPLLRQPSHVLADPEAARGDVSTRGQGGDAQMIIRSPRSTAPGLSPPCAPRIRSAAALARVPSAGRG